MKRDDQRYVHILFIGTFRLLTSLSVLLYSSFSFSGEGGSSLISNGSLPTRSRYLTYNTDGKEEMRYIFYISAGTDMLVQFIVPFLIAQILGKYIQPKQ